MPAWKWWLRGSATATSFRDPVVSVTSDALCDTGETGGVSRDDQARWDQRYAERGSKAGDSAAAPSAFADLVHLFPTSGRALDVACGAGQSSVWLAQRGLDVWGFDVSPVAVGLASGLAEMKGVADACQFTVEDLDQGLPDGPPVDLVLCHLFREPALDAAIVDRLAPGGLLAIAVLSEVGDRSGSFRAAPGELAKAFAGLEILDHREGSGQARLLGRLAGPGGSTRLD